MRRASHALAAAALLTALAGCAMGSNAASPGGGGTTSGSSPSASASSTPGASSGAVLTTSTSSLGKIVVDGKGMTVYYYSPDKPGSGKSTCTGGCAALWPAVETTSTTPKVQGVTGTVGTITGVDGKLQVTIDKRPIYTYANDSKPGDVNGQGFGGIWWVMDPTGAEVMQMPSSTSSGVGTGGY
ncbi:MAG: hypothetical protein FWF90_01190 [Promicromonosporaceae bacterium]|nr:hypothetical protein [Promicromonosporaceae bacterium]